MSRKFNLILFCLFCLVSSSAHARIYILIDQVSEKKFPIAVPTFVSPSGSKKGGVAKKMLELVHKDLRIADMFNVLDDSLLPQDDRDTTNINFEKWRSLEVGALVKGVVTPSGIQMRVYDVGEGKMIMGKQYSVNGGNYVEASHRFVDSLLEALTGVRGPFNSNIAASCGKPFKRRIGAFKMDSEPSKSGVSATNTMSPAVSPDGKSIAYTAFNPKFPEVFVNGRKITNFNSTTITPAWTPDGSNLVVASAFTGDTELYLIDLNGRIVNQLTHTPNIDFNPSVSQTGRVVFSSERAGGLQLFETTLSGGGARQLTYTGYQNDQPDWSPDGSKITFSSRDRGAFDIFVMDANGSNILRVTREEGNNESPVWSPDSRYLAFYSDRGGIHVMLEEGLKPTRVDKSDGCMNVDWGPWLSQ